MYAYYSSDLKLEMIGYLAEPEGEVFETQMMVFQARVRERLVVDTAFKRRLELYRQDRELQT